MEIAVAVAIAVRYLLLKTDGIDQARIESRNRELDKIESRKQK